MADERLSEAPAADIRRAGAPFGDASGAEAASGEAPYGEAPYGEAPSGEAPSGEARGDASPFGKAASGDASGDVHMGDASKGDAPVGDAPMGDAPTGEPSGDVPAGGTALYDASPPDGPAPDGPFAPVTEGSQRLVKWLLQTRFFKTRGLEARVVSDGKVRVNSVRVSKPSRAVAAGDTLTFPQGAEIRVVRVLALPVRRGPAPEARSCYADVAPPEPRRDPTAPRPGGPRPTKKDRRNLPDS